MNRNVVYSNRLFWSALLVDLHSLHLGQSSKAIVANDLSEDGIQAVKMRRLVQGDEELRSIGIRSFVCHGHYSTRAVTQSRANLVLKGTAPNGLATFRIIWCRIRGAASLYHEVGNKTMEGRAVEIARSAKSEEILEVIMVSLWALQGSKLGALTSAVFGTLSQNTSILMSPWDVWRVTDMLGKGCAILRRQDQC